MSECCICIEPLLDRSSQKIRECTKLSCDHSFHTECIRGLTKLACPLCRKTITLEETSEEVVKSILANEMLLQKEREEEELQELRNYASDMQVINTDQLEYVFSVRYLQEIGVPERYLPADVLIKRTEVPLRNGSLFMLVVGTVMGEIERELLSDLSNSNEESSSEESD